MAHIYSKGWFVQELKKVGINKLNGKKIESYKSHVLASEWKKAVEKK